jgi:molecular chaperone GrpE
MSKDNENCSNENCNNEEDLNEGSLNRDCQRGCTSDSEGCDPESRDANFSELDLLEQVVQLKKDLEQAKSESDTNKNNYLRALADFENFKKRSIKDRSELMRYEGEKIIADFIEVKDNFDLAIQHKDAEIENYKAGVDMIAQQFTSVFERWQVLAESSVGKPFDPHNQVALSSACKEGVEPGIVVEEYKKTYTYKGKVIRQGQVVVSEAAKQDADDINSKSEQIH